MRRITLWLLSTVAALVLLFSYRTSTTGGDPAGTAAAAGTAGTSTGAGVTGSAATSGGATTYKGSVTQTRWGPVQVTVTVADGRITSVAVPTYPNGNGRDKEINAYALPVLKQETIDAQSADVDTVSGATVTSNGYKQSLQAALDAAHLS
jgi:uncharacterized protein with FMN-binding domain